MSVSRVIHLLFVPAWPLAKALAWLMNLQAGRVELWLLYALCWLKTVGFAAMAALGLTVLLEPEPTYALVSKQDIALPLLGGVYGCACVAYAFFRAGQGLRARLDAGHREDSAG